jgi:hypothetical protein
MVSAGFSKIGQIGICTHRSVSGLAARARASARITVRKSGASKTSPAPNAIRTLKRRERRAPAAPEHGNRLGSKPAPTCVLSPRRGFRLDAFSFYPEGCPPNPAADYFKEAGSVSPSPREEGPDETGDMKPSVLRGYFDRRRSFTGFRESCQMVLMITSEVSRLITKKTE